MMTTEAFDRIFAGADRVSYPPTVRSYRQSDMEQAIGGSGRTGLQPDSVRTFGRLTLDSDEPVEIRYRDGMVEFKDEFQQVEAIPATDVRTFPALIQGFTSFSTTPPRWKYSWAEAKWNDITKVWYVAGPRTSFVTTGGVPDQFGHPAYNMIETPLTGAGGHMWRNYFVVHPAGTPVEMFEYINGNSNVHWFDKLNNAFPPTGTSASVSAVHGAVNATYDILVITNNPFDPTQISQTVTVTNVTPANRELDMAHFGYLAASIGDPVQIVVGVGGGAYWIIERLGDTAC